MYKFTSSQQRISEHLHHMAAKTQQNPGLMGWWGKQTLKKQNAGFSDRMGNEL